ncbi:MAG: ABC transporter permease [Candidatus Thermoplasmatota archaeon]|nr:ABC transporter permease [Candidatus Thermoplasmatota archaeon]
MKLWHYIIRRLLLLIPILLGVSIIVFALAHSIPGDPAYMLAGGIKSTPEQVNITREKFKLNEPLHIQYFYYLSNLFHGDLGISATTGNPVARDLITCFPATFELTTFATIIAIIIGIPLGVVSATRRDKLPDILSRIFALAGASIPIFWLGLALKYIFYYRLDILPGRGRGEVAQTITGLYTIDNLIVGRLDLLVDNIKHLIMPSICLAFVMLATITRVMRSSMLEVLGEDYIRTARAKGLRERKVIYKHALRNALIPTVTVIGMSYGALLAGSVLTETIFSWDGIGCYAVDAIKNLDYSAIMGFTLLVAFIFVIVNLIVDILYCIIDPRIRYG